MANVLEKEWQSYFEQLNETEKKSLLQLLKTFLKSRKEITNRISIEQYNKELNEAMQQVKNGDVHSHDDVVKMAKNW